MEIVLAIVGKCVEPILHYTVEPIVGYTVAPIARQVGYVIFYKHNFKNLKDQVVELKRVKDTISHEVEAERRNGRQVRSDGKSWLDRVDKIIEAAEQLGDDPHHGDAGCCKGPFPDLKSRHQLSRNAKKMAANISEVMQGKDNIYPLTFLPNLEGVGSASATSSDKLESRRKMKEDIVLALRDPNLSLIGVYGLGGVGKTTLVKELAKQVKDDKMFDEVVVANVSQAAADLERIQGEIADFLGLRFEETTIAGKADRLRQRIKSEKSILIILDDIWATLDLEKIGIPPNDHKGCKLLLTSRNLDILQKMETRKDFFIDVLNKEESWSLFEDMVGDVLKDVCLRDVAIQVAEKCAGLIVLVATVARALKNKNSTDSWKDALNQLKVVDKEGMNGKIYSALEFSYNHLEGDEVKALFLLCGSLGPQINVEYLLKCAVGLGIFKQTYTLKDARRKLHRLICSLKASCLLLENNSIEEVKMHDTVHEVAVSIGSRDQHVCKIGRGSKLWPSEEFLQKCTQIFFDRCDIRKLPERLECPNVKFLFLDNKDASLSVPDSFFGGMKNLKVLDLTHIRLPSLPQSFHSLINLQTLCLDYCALGDLTDIGALRNLQILSLYGSFITLPSELGQLTHLRMLDLTNSIIKIFPSNIISKLTKLEELYLGNTSIMWDQEDSNDENKSAFLTELRHLTNLTALEIQIKGAWLLPRDIMFNKLERYKIVIGDVWGYWYDSYEASKVLKIKLGTVSHLEHGIKELIKGAEALYLDEVNGISDVLGDLNGEGFPSLKYLCIQNNGKIRHIINLMDMKVFPQLETLTLQNLNILKKICRGSFANNSFAKLRSVKVKCCDQLKYLFSVLMVKALCQLIEIEVSECSSMKKIVFVENSFPNSMTYDDNIEFSSLRSLTLQSLPSIKEYYSGLLTYSTTSKQSLLPYTNVPVSFFNAKVKFSNLETLKLSSIHLENIWHQDQLSITNYFHKLDELSIEDCSGLKYLFSSFVAGSFPNLKNLEIRGCEMMEQIIGAEERNGAATQEVLFPNLETITISEMPNLRTIWHPFFNSNSFSNLKTMQVYECGKLENIFPSYMERAFTSLEALTVADCNSVQVIFEFSSKMGRVEDTTQLQNLTLSGLSNLKQIWSRDPQENLPFHKLQHVLVENCNDLEYLFPLSIALHAIHLEDIIIRDAERMKHIVSEKGGIVDNQVVFRNLNLLELSQCPELKELWCSHVQSGAFGNLKNLTVHKCDFSSKVLLPLNLLKALANLENLEVRECHSLEALIELPQMNEGRIMEKVFLPRLKTMIAEDMENLETIWHSVLAPNSMGNFETLEVKKCHKIEHIFPMYMHGAFATLEMLVVEDCNSVQEIFQLDVNEMHSGDYTPLLKSITLLQLPKLKQIWNRDPNSSICFKNLQLVCVEDCEDLEYLFPFSIAMNLPLLEQITIKQAMRIKEIVSKREESLDNPVKFEFKSLTSLVLCNLDDLERFCAGNHSLACHSLKELYVFSCMKLKLFTTQSVSSQGRLPDGNLQVSMQQPLLTLEEVMDNLEQLAPSSEHLSIILQGHFSGKHFKKLKVLILREIEDGQTTFPYWFVQNIPSLEHLTVEWSSFKEIFSEKVPIHPEGKNENNTRIKKLNLRELHELHHICKEGCQTDPILEVLECIEVDECSKLNYLVPSSVTFNHLTYLEVRNCKGLIYLITSSTARSLNKLKTLKIRECNSVEEIVSEKGEDSINEITFNSLTVLELDSLSKLQMFCSSNCLLKLPLLWRLEINQCPRMTSFSAMQTWAPLLRNILTGGKYIWEGDLTRTVNKMFQDKVAFSSFNRLELSEYPELKELWYGQVGQKIFCNLKHLVVSKCTFLSNTIFSSNLLGVLYSLEELEVAECDSLEAVFDIKAVDGKAMESKQVSGLKTLKLSGLPNLKCVWNKEAGELISFGNLQIVRVDKCQNLKCVFLQSLCQELRQLEELNIAYCGVEQIVANEEGLDGPKFCFPLLKIFRLRDLIQLNDFYPKRYSLECPVLEVLDVGQCEALQIFSFGPLDSQQNRGFCVDLPIRAALFHIEKVSGHLEELSLNEKDAKSILNADYEKKLFQRTKTLRLQYFQGTPIKYLNELLERFPSAATLQPRWSSFETLFPTAEINHFNIKNPTQIKNLWLYQLEQLEHIWNDSFASDALVPNLEDLSILECSRLKSLAPSTASFTNLTLLLVDDCNGLVYFMSSFTAKSLVHLTRLTVRNCMMLEEVVMTNEGGSKEEEIIFKRLKDLELTCLSRFKSFCFGKHTFIFPSLVTLKVIGCHKMQTFSFGIIVAPFLKLVEVENGKKHCKEDLNTTIKHLFIEQTNEHLNVETTDASSSKEQVRESKANQIADTGNQETHKFPSESIDREQNEQASPRIERPLAQVTQDTEESQELKTQSSKNMVEQGTNVNNKKTLSKETEGMEENIERPLVETANIALSPAVVCDAAPSQVSEATSSSTSPIEYVCSSLKEMERLLPYLKDGANRHPQVLDWLNTEKQRALASSSFSLFAEVTRILRTTRRGELTEDDRNYIRECCRVLEVVGFDASWLSYVYKCIEECGEAEDIKKEVEETKDQASSLEAQLESIKKKLVFLLDKASRLDDFIES